MKRMVFLLSVSIILLSVQVYAQRNITVLNPSFEKPDSGKVKGFDGKSLDPKTDYKHIDVPNWNVDSPDSLQWDSGVEKKTTSDGQYDAFLMGADSAIYQNLTRRVFDDDRLKLTVDARNSWKGTLLKMELYYLDNDTVKKANRVVIASDIKTLTNTMTGYSISVNGSDAPLAVGHKLGILLDNVSPDSASWVELDNVRLTNEDPTIIEVPNYSFEQPDSNKIKGWNGPGSSPNIANSTADIPGWASDTTINDSGIDGRGLFDPQEGQYVGFLMGSDTSVWNTTDYVIQDGDVITLRVLAKNVWAAEILRTEMYCVDANNKRVTLAFDDQTPLNTDQTWGEQSLEFAAASAPACVGKKLGVLLDNSSPTGASWIDFDLVRLNANHAVVQTSVSQTQLKPAMFSLAQNYPNPFNPSTKISYLLTNTGKVRLSVYDILGREIAVLANEIQTVGAHEVTFSANGLSSGIYFYKLQAANGVITKKMMLLK
jgi:hypothetical protein